MGASQNGSRRGRARCGRVPAFFSASQALEGRGHHDPTVAMWEFQSGDRRLVIATPSTGVHSLPLSESNLRLAGYLLPQQNRVFFPL
jgi:hypothetical protein